MATGSIIASSDHPQTLPPECLPDYDSLITEDDKPVDNIYAERQHQLLTGSLIDSWDGPRKGEPRYIATDVGLFFSDQEPPFAPDVMISLGVALPQENHLAKNNRSYFCWRYNKPPDLTLEVVSNLIGGELTTKLAGYARIGVTYYVVWDPETLLSEQKLHCYTLEHGKYVPCEPWFPALELGVKIWDGVFAEMSGTFLRWCDANGAILPTGAERAMLEKQRADKFAQKLRELGVDPDAV